MNVLVLCIDCHRYLPSPAERDEYSGEWWPISNDVPEHECKGAKP